jgi:hypothetical protein
LSDGAIRNAYDLRLRNKTGTDAWFWVTITSAGRLTVAVEGTEEPRVLVPANETLETRVFVEAAAETEAAQADRTDLRLWVSSDDGTQRVWHDTIFNGKGE